MQRKTFLTVIALTLAGVFAYAYSTQDEPVSPDLAQRDARLPMKNLTNTSSLETMSQTITSHTPDSVDFKPPVLE